VELRRALLLFAIVLGIAAIATSLTGGSTEREDKPESRPAGGATPIAGPQPERAETAALSFSTKRKPRTERLEAGRAATVIVEVAQAGEVGLPEMGLSGTAEPLTPARFDVLERRAGTYAVRFTSAQSGESRVVGKLRIVP